MKAMSFRRIGKSVFSVGLALGLLAMGSGAQSQPLCKVTVSPGESIQQAIDAAPSDAVICLAPGRWEENLVITKSLTLRGTGKEPKEVWIVGTKEGHPVMRIESEREIEVQLENLAVAEAKGWKCAVESPQWICPDGLQALGKAKVLIKDMQVSNNRDGLFVRDSAMVSLTNSTVSNNGSGLSVRDSAMVSLSHSQVSNNGDGLFVGDSATVSLSHSQVSNAGWWGLFVGDSATVSLGHSQVSNTRIGLAVGDSATVSLSHSQLSDNGIGVGLRGSAQVSLSHSTVSNNWFIGLAAEIGSATVTLQNSIVSGNGRGLVVGDSTTVRVEGSEISGNEGHGIFLQDKAVAEIWGNRILNNGGYGIVLYWEGCVDADYKADFKFAGQVMGEGNTIPGKEEPDGNKQGDLCPPDYPWPPGFRKP